MDTTEEFKSEMLGLEKQYWESMRDQDLDMALSLTDFPCIVAGPHGAMAVEKEQFVEMFKKNAGMVVGVFHAHRDRNSKALEKTKGRQLAALYFITTVIGD